MIYTPLYYDKITTKEKKKVNGHTRKAGALSWQPPPYLAPPVASRRKSAFHRVTSSAPRIHPVSRCSQRWWWVLSSSSTLIVVGQVVTWPLAPDPPLRANAHSGGCRVLGLPPALSFIPSPCHHLYAPAFLPTSSCS